MSKFKRTELLPSEKESLKNFINDLIEENNLDQLEENLNYTEADTMSYIEKIADDEEIQDDFLLSQENNFIEFLETIIYQSLVWGI